MKTKILTKVAKYEISQIITKFFFLTTGNRDSSESYKNVKFRKIHFFEDNARVTILIPFSTLSSPKVDQSISKG